jgi:hypothetical protein
MAGIGDVLHILADLLRTVVVPGFPRNPDAQPRLICASTATAAELLDFAPRVSLIAGLARVVRSMAEGEGVERPALAPVGLDD